MHTWACTNKHNTQNNTHCSLTHFAHKGPSTWRQFWALKTCTKFPAAGQRKPTLHTAFSFKVSAKVGIFYNLLPGDSTLNVNRSFSYAPTTPPFPSIKIPNDMQPASKCAFSHYANYEAVRKCPQDNSGVFIHSYLA